MTDSAVVVCDGNAAQGAPAALPAVLYLLMLKGCIVTIDAVGYQTEIAKTIIERLHTTPVSISA